MIELKKNKIGKAFSKNEKSYASVCNSCACTGGACQTCKGCKDKGENVKEVKNIYRCSK